MKSLFLILSLSFLSNGGHAQEKIWLDKKSNWTDEANAKYYAVVSKDRKLTKVETFTVGGLKKEICHYSKYGKKPNERIKEGVRTVFYANGKDSLIANYKENKLHGKYSVYYPDGNISISTNYKNSKINGKLLQYYPDGKLKREETYKNSECTKGRLLSEDGTEIDHIPYLVEPFFPGGMQQLLQLITRAIKYPEEALEYRIDGSVLIRFVVDKDGTMIEPKVFRSDSEVLSKEALRAFSAIAAIYKWTPGFIDGKPVRVLFTAPITFVLPM